MLSALLIAAASIVQCMLASQTAPAYSSRALTCCAPLTVPQEVPVLLFSGGTVFNSGGDYLEVTLQLEGGILGKGGCGVVGRCRVKGRSPLGMPDVFVAKVVSTGSPLTKSPPVSVIAAIIEQQGLSRLQHVAKESHILESYGVGVIVVRVDGSKVSELSEGRQTTGEQQWQQQQGTASLPFLRRHLGWDSRLCKGHDISANHYAACA
jgi:hypothetical protein